MKRLLIVLILVIFAGAGLGYWWYLRDTPQKVLRDGILSLDGLHGAKRFQAYIAITDREAGTTSGYTFLGQLDVKDVTKPVLLGILNIGAKTTTERDQTLDVVLTADKIALLPQSVNEENLELYKRYAGESPVGTFIQADRKVFFDKTGYQAATGLGKSDDIRSAFLYVLPALIIDGPLETAKTQNSKSASVNFRFDRSATKPFMMELLRAWHKATSTVEEYAWIDLAAEGLVRGNFKMVIDANSRQISRLSGTWPVILPNGQEGVRLSVILDFQGVNQTVTVKLPTQVKDVTDVLMRRVEPTTLPSSGFKPGAATTTTSTVPLPTPEELQNRKADIDVFNKYSEELRKKSLY